MEPTLLKDVANLFYIFYTLVLEWGQLKEETF